MENAVNLFVALSIILATFAGVRGRIIKSRLKREHGWNRHDVLKGFEMTNWIRAALVAAYLLILICVLVLMHSNN